MISDNNYKSNRNGNQNIQNNDIKINLVTPTLKQKYQQRRRRQRIAGFVILSISLILFIVGIVLYFTTDLFRPLFPESSKPYWKFVSKDIYQTLKAKKDLLSTDKALTRVKDGNIIMIHYSLYIPKKVKNIKGVIVCGYGSSIWKKTFNVDPFISLAVDRGYIIYNMFGRRMSKVSKKQGIITNLEDYIYFIRQAKHGHLKELNVVTKAMRKDVSELKYVFFGQSFGGYSALMLATYKHKSIKSDPIEYFDGFISDAGFSSIQSDLDCMTTMSLKRDITVKSQLNSNDPHNWYHDTFMYMENYNKKLQKSGKDIDTEPFYNFNNIKKPVLLIHNIFDDDVGIESDLYMINRLYDENIAYKYDVYFHTMGRDLGKHNYGNIGDYEAVWNWIDWIISSNDRKQSKEEHLSELKQYDQISMILYRAKHPNNNVRLPHWEYGYHLLLESNEEILNKYKCKSYIFFALFDALVQKYQYTTYPSEMLDPNDGAHDNNIVKYKFHEYPRQLRKTLFEELYNDDMKSIYSDPKQASECIGQNNEDYPTIWGDILEGNVNILKETWKEAGITKDMLDKSKYSTIDSL